MSSVIPPGSTIGVLGGGQLGRMFTMAANRLGYRVHVLADSADGPAGQVAQAEQVAAFDDLDAVARFAKQVDVVTYEFENVPAEAASTAERFAPVRPGPGLLHVSRNRVREKTTFRDLGIPVAPFLPVGSLEELHEALGSLGAPAILKTCESGYDGKGQLRLDESTDLTSAWVEVDSADCVLEGWVDFQRELSVIACRGQDGSFASYDPIENVHENGILDVSISPAQCAESVRTSAAEIARTFAEALDVVGVFCIELFDTASGLIVNEVAPRPHNSGHLTIEGHVVSQYEQQLRAICGLPLGATVARSPAAMANLIGDVWRSGPSGATMLALPGVFLHDYGKSVAVPGRKMGHLTAIAGTTAEARDLVIEGRRRLDRR